MQEKTDEELVFLTLQNQDNFSQFVQMHQLRQAGDWEAAQKIADELGIPQLGKFMGSHRGWQKTSAEQQS